MKLFGYKIYKQKQGVIKMYTKQNKKIIEAMELLNEVNNELKTIEKEKGIKSPYRLTMGHSIDSAFDSVLGEIYKTRSN